MEFLKSDKEKDDVKLAEEIESNKSRINECWK